MRARIQLPLQTADLIAGFMAWVILSSLLPAIKQDIVIPENQLALLTAVPVVLGSVLRVPFGYLADLLGARVMFTASFVLLLARSGSSALRQPGRNCSSAACSSVWAARYSP